MEAVHSPASPSIQLLHHLPPALFALITQFIPLPDKLLHLTHVSHTFPFLTPPAFVHDTLAWTPTLLTRLTTPATPSTPTPSSSASPTPPPPSPLLFLLSHIPHALYHGPPGIPLHSLCHLP